MSSTLFDLSGRTALVTGGSKGLGKAMARALAKAGSSVAISSRHDDELRTAAAEIAQESPAKVVSLAADMTHRGEVKRLAEQAIAALGKVDILINNAGGNTPAADRSDHRRGLGSLRRAESIKLHGAYAGIGSPNERPEVGPCNSHFINFCFHFGSRAQHVTLQPKAPYWA